MAMNPGTSLNHGTSPLPAIMFVAILFAVPAGCAHEAPVLADLSSYDNMDVNEDGLHADHCARAGTSSTDGSCREMGLPRNVGALLYCPHPETAPAGQPLCLQCAVKPGTKADAVLAHYRRRGDGPWSTQSVPMRQMRSGWFRGTIPAAVMRGHTLEVYFEALDGIDRVATFGEWDSPHSITLCGAPK
jgi:hypothetical protein